MSPLANQVIEIEQSGVHVMLAVGVDSDGGTKIRRVNGTKWNQELLDRVREAVELVHEEILGEEEQIAFTKEKQRKKNQWWPDTTECVCGHVMRLDVEPDSYLVECPACGHFNIVMPVR